MTRGASHRGKCGEKRWFGKFTQQCKCPLYAPTLPQQNTPSYTERNYILPPPSLSLVPEDDGVVEQLDEEATGNA